MRLRRAAAERQACSPVLAALLASLFAATATADPAAPVRVLAARATKASVPAAYTNSTTVFPKVSNSTSMARFGHSALYDPLADQILFVGGQVDKDEMVITNEVLLLDLQKGYKAGAKVPVAANLSANFPAHAWSAVASDASNRGWVVGGVTANCETARGAYVLSGGGWNGLSGIPRSPGRRRQAQAVPVKNSTSGHIDLFVFGGIADPYTCSEETIGYMGIDVWRTGTGEVESMPWKNPVNVNDTKVTPAVSDYTASLLNDRRRIAFIGGQMANGSMVPWDRLLLYNTKRKQWTIEYASGKIPSPRLGHAAVALDSGPIMVHGGLNANLRPQRDLYLLSPPSSTSTNWTWSVPWVSNHSLAAPKKAWHTMTRTANVTVFAFGVEDGKATLSDDLFFLTEDDLGHFTWSDSYTPAPVLPEKPVIAAVATSTRDYVPNPKAASAKASPYLSTFSVVEPSTTEWDVPTATAMASSSPSGSPTFDAAVAKAAQKTTAVAATLGGLVGLAAVVGILFWGQRYYSSRVAATQGLMLTPSTITTPFVSNLLYTRPVPKRMLSLGSATSAETEKYAHTPLSPQSSASAYSGDVADTPLAYQRDPFADNYHVNELGQISRSASIASHIAASVTSGLSARSYPFLSAIARTYSSETTASSRGSTARSASGVGAVPPVPPLPHGADSYTSFAHDRVNSRRRTSGATGTFGGGGTVVSDTRDLPTYLRTRQPLRVANVAMERNLSQDSSNAATEEK